MSCCGKCFANASVASSDCIAMSGTGQPGNPLIATPVIPATVTHPLLATLIANGLSCEVAGLEVQPDRQWAPTGPFGLGGGFVPTIVADTAPGPHTLGMIDWGTPTVGAGVNQDANRDTLMVRIESLPLVIATLEPGAGFSFGHSFNFPFFDIVDLSFVNTGATIGTWRFWLGNRLGASALVGPGVGNPGAAETYQLTVRTTGFLGASAISTFFGSKIQLAYLGFPL